MTRSSVMDMDRRVPRWYLYEVVLRSEASARCGVRVNEMSLSAGDFDVHVVGEDPGCNHRDRCKVTTIYLVAVFYYGGRVWLDVDHYTSSRARRTRQCPVRRPQRSVKRPD